MNAPTPLLAMRGIGKRFGAVQANHNVDLTLQPGDILGLLGENGAGKTTLMNILFGTYSPDEGRIEIDGQTVEIHNSAAAIAHGVGMVHQHFHLVPRHTVLENLLVGRKGRNGLLDKAAAVARLEDIGRHFQLILDPDRLVGDLTIGEQQRLEIIKALFSGARILILDEPTAALTPQEADGLFDALRAMAAEGMGVIFISHKLHEVRAITSHVMVMRLGEVVANLENAPEVSQAHLAELMCGHELTPPVKPEKLPGRPLLQLRRAATNAAGRTNLADISLEIAAGEILGIAGVSGNGQRELAEVIAGMLPLAAGSLEVDSATVPHPSANVMQALGVGRIPEDRMGTGLITSLPLSDSMVLPRIGEAPFSRRGVMDHRAIRAFVEEQIERFGIKADGPDIRAGTLSGGNLQKALLARELAWDPLVLLAAQPTRGLDVGAARFVHELFLDMRARDRAVILISEDLEEIFTLSDRVAVMYEGRIMGILPIAEADIRKVGLMMAGMDEAA
jgi:simple sugar transport system ATP-binding protein